MLFGLVAWHVEPWAVPAIAYLAAMPFMHTTLIEGFVARAWHGADIAYFVNFAVAAVLYGGYRMATRRRVRGPEVV